MAEDTIPPGIWHIYRITHIDSGKSYVGLTKNLPRRWNAHCSAARRSDTRMLLHKAIRKYGPRSFVVTVLETVPTLEMACAAEIRLIAAHGTLVPAGYNLARGGHSGATTGHKWSEQQRRRVKKALTGRKVPRDIVEKVAAKLRGRRLSPAHAAIIRVAGKKNRGKKRSRNQITGRSAVILKSTLVALEKKPIGCTMSYGRFRATIGYHGKRFEIGTYDTLHEAWEARKAATRAYLEELETGVVSPIFKVDTLTRQSDAMSRRWATPGYAEKVSARISETKGTEERREKARKQMMERERCQRSGRMLRANP